MSKTIDELEEFIREELKDMTLEEFLELHGDLDPVDVIMYLWADGRLDLWEFDPYIDDEDTFTDIDEL